MPAAVVVAARLLWRYQNLFPRVLGRESKEPACCFQQRAPIAELHRCCVLPTDCLESPKPYDLPFATRQPLYHP